MHLNLTLSDCFSLSYDIAGKCPGPSGGPGVVRLRIPKDQFAPLIRRGVRCRLAVSPVQGRPGRVTEVRERENGLVLDVKLRRGFDGGR